MSAPSDRPLVLFLGDSITEAADWERFFPALAVRNAGVPGDRTRDILARLPRVVESLHGRQPAVVALLAGSNDLGLSARPVPDVVADLRIVCLRLREAFPTARVLVQSVMPRTARFTEDLVALNGGVETLARDLGLDHLDLWPALADARGRLRRGFTRDGLHLTERGYAAWLEVLAPAIEHLVSRGSDPRTDGGPSA